jgi:hypothetical protein
MEVVLILFDSCSSNCIVSVEKLRLCIDANHLVGSQNMRKFIACADTFIPKPNILFNFGFSADWLDLRQFKSQGSILSWNFFRCCLVLRRCHNYKKFCNKAKVVAVTWENCARCWSPKNKKTLVWKVILQFKLVFSWSHSSKPHSRSRTSGIETSVFKPNLPPYNDWILFEEGFRLRRLLG